MAIQTKINRVKTPTKRCDSIMNSFVKMLENKDFIKNRSLSYYSSQLSITPHYLSEISKKLTGYTARHWIDSYIVNEINKLLKIDNLTISQIADMLQFSSIQHLSYYIKKHTGKSPSKNRLKELK